MWTALATLAVIALQQPAAAPAAPGAAGGATLLVLNKTDGTLSFVDPDGGASLAVIGTGVGPHEIAVAPNGKRAVVANYGTQRPGQSLTVVDLERRVPLETIDLGPYPRPHGIVYLSDTRILVTSEVAKMLVEVDLAERKVVRAMPTEQDASHMVAITPDKKRAFVANIASGSVSAIDLSTGALLAKIETGAGAEGIDCSPDGREVWVANRSGDSISVVSVDGHAEVEEVPCAKFPIRIKLTPDGERALVSCAQSGDVAVIDVARRKEVARIPMQVAASADSKDHLMTFGQSPTPVGIVIEPGGKRAFVANTNADIVTVLDLEKLAVAGRLKAGREPDGLAWAAR